MKERPILFNGEMVVEVLDDNKIHTRRVIVPQPRVLYNDEGDGKLLEPDNWLRDSDGNWMPRVGDVPGDLIRCPYGIRGDRLWVREAFSVYHRADATPVRGQPHDPFVVYRADDDEPESNIPLTEPFRWRPSIHMPRKHSRINLEIVDVRVERVQDITEAGARAEGVVGCARQNSYPRGTDGQPDRAEFPILWDSINKSRGYGWDTNPWVWVVEFKRLR